MSALHSRCPASPILAPPAQLPSHTPFLDRDVGGPCRHLSTLTRPLNRGRTVRSPAAVGALAGHIVMSDVRFSYPSRADTPVLRVKQTV